RFLELLRKEQVTVLNQVPSVFYGLSSEESARPKRELSPRYVIFGGEALKPARLVQWQKMYPGTRLINMFGITETTVHVTYKEIGDKETRLETDNIGRPLPSLTVYVMGVNLLLLPAGVAGELCVGGSGVGRGYLNRPVLTAEKFLENPYQKGETLYRSGDLARLIEHNEIEYLGRMDHQVKIRGFRIETGEIETLLLGHHQVKEAVVIAGSAEKTGTRDPRAGAYLCAYVVLEDSASSSVSPVQLREYLTRQLPDYMIPSYIAVLEKLPLTAQGKFDRQVLPGTVAIEPDSQAVYAAPGNRVEKKLAETWQNLLNRDKIGIYENFFMM
ncbi:MAG: amino acid adenylation domain-containing protein, partial [bacterium]|nr:amino acid adenylation domain-containing protein [bacterium]